MVSPRLIEMARRWHQRNTQQCHHGLGTQAGDLSLKAGKGCLSSSQELTGLNVNNKQKNIAEVRTCHGKH